MRLCRWYAILESRMCGHLAVLDGAGAGMVWLMRTVLASLFPLQWPTPGSCTHHYYNHHNQCSCGHGGFVYAFILKGTVVAVEPSMQRQCLASRSIWSILFECCNDVLHVFQHALCEVFRKEVDCFGLGIDVGPRLQHEGTCNTQQRGTALQP